MSESEEMYLVTTAVLEESGLQSPFQVSMLAKELSIQPVSANQMIRRLEESGLVTYTPYKGVTMTDDGRAIALRILRHRRLWEVFLVDKLNLPADTAKELACQMEHIASTEVMSRLATFLGEPTISPEGKWIPPGDSDVNMKLDIPLGQLKVSEQGIVSRLETDATTRSFLIHEGILPRTTLTLLGVGGDGDLLVEVNHQTIHLTSRVGEMIWVHRRPTIS